MVEKATLLPPNRHLGTLMVIVLLIISIYTHTLSITIAALLALVSAIIIGVLTIFKPGLLTPVNRSWMWIGTAIGNIVSPVVMAVLYFGLITPFALGGKLFGRDELLICTKKIGTSKWQKRSPIKKPTQYFTKQF